jgi:hypothetical protein
MRAIRTPGLKINIRSSGVLLNEIQQRGIYVSMQLKTVHIENQQRSVRAKRRRTLRRCIDGLFREDPTNPGVFSNGQIAVRIEFDPNNKFHQIGARNYLAASALSPEEELKTDKVNKSLKRLGDIQLQLYKTLVMDRVADRFAEPEAAEEWFATGSLPGYGDRTPEQLVRDGHVDRVIEAVDAANAGVYA